MRISQRLFLFLTGARSEENRTQIYRINADNTDTFKLHPDNLRSSASHNFLQQNQKGQVLILTLLILIILSLLSLSFSYRMRLEISLTSAKRDYLKTLTIAKAGVYYAIESERKGNHFSGKKIELGDGSFSYNIESEEGKININTAKEDLLREIPGLDQKIIQTILKARAEKKFSSLEELLLVKDITPYLLWGEDANGNGLLDPSEDDGWLSPSAGTS
ncbi:helix-hairpin-helix domain-containing protein [bacterium]|nr:helix-hairpin-helix domain-containing protein [bacterium]